MWRDRRTGGKAALASPQQSTNDADSPPCPSLRLPHNFSPSSLLATCHLSLSLSLFSPRLSIFPPSPAPVFTLFLFLPPSTLFPPPLSASLPALPSSPSSDSGRVCRVRHFSQRVSEDQRKVLQCRLGRRLCNASPGPVTQS